MNTHIREDFTLCESCSKIVSGLRHENEVLRQRNAHLEAALEKALLHPITLLPGRARYEEELAKLMAYGHRHDTPFTLVLCDIDHFKAVNDTYGHPAGDQVLKDVGQVLRNMVRPYDMVAHIGGEEFAILLAKTKEEEAFLVMERVRRAMAARKFVVSLGDIYQSISVTMSMGVGEYTEVKSTSDDLYRAVDVALYQAKETGRNKVVCVSQLR